MLLQRLDDVPFRLLACVVDQFRSLGAVDSCNDSGGRDVFGCELFGSKLSNEISCSRSQKVGKMSPR